MEEKMHQKRLIGKEKGGKKRKKAWQNCTHKDQKSENLKLRRKKENSSQRQIQINQTTKGFQERKC